MRGCLIAVLCALVLGCSDSTGPATNDLPHGTYAFSVARTGTGTPSWGGTVEVSGNDDALRQNFAFTVPGFPTELEVGAWTGAFWQVLVTTESSPTTLIVLRITHTTCSATLNIGPSTGIPGDCTLALF